MFSIIPDNVRNFLNYDSKTGHFFWVRSPAPVVKTGQRAGSINDEGYINISFKSLNYKAHRLAWFLFYNEQPHLSIDHINGDRSDNRIVNLRMATSFEQAHNFKCHRAGRPLGVSMNRHAKKFAAWVPKKYGDYFNKKPIYLGLFTDEKLANAAIVSYIKGASCHRDD